MRGSGSSSGFKAWSASTDAADAAALCDHLGACGSGAGVAAQRQGGGGSSDGSSSGGSKASKRVMLVAYSYGSCVAAEAIHLCKMVSAAV